MSRFWAPFGEPVEALGSLFWGPFFFGFRKGARDAFSAIRGQFWEAFWGHLADFLAPRWPFVNCAPARAPASKWRSGGVQPARFSSFFRGPVSGPLFFEILVRFGLILGSLLSPWGGPAAHFSSILFPSIFRAQSGGGYPKPGASYTWRRSRVCVFGHFEVLRQYHEVFLDFSGFWISGAAEREITSGNLPLSEVLRQSFALTDTGEFSGGVPRRSEEVRRNLGIQRMGFQNGNPAVGRTTRHHVPEARWRIHCRCGASPLKGHYTTTMVNT